MSEHPLAVQHRLPAGARDRVEEKAKLASDEELPRRLRAGDATLWGPPGAPEIADRLGWLTTAARMRASIPELESFVAEVRRDGLARAVLLGMGGSSLAPEVLRRAFPRAEGALPLDVLDSTDPDEIRGVEDRIDPERTLFLVSSKSGGTIEPLSLFAHFYSRVGDGGNFVAITDPGSGLERLAREHRFRRVFHGDPEIGGRYSALSPFGIVPGALMGIDIAVLLDGADAAWEVPLAEPAPPSAPLPAAVWLGAALSALAQDGRDKLTFVIDESLPGLGLWLEQLVAESTGKHGTGILPVADEPLGEPEEYAEDRVFAYLPDRTAPDRALEARVEALAGAGHPVLVIPTEGPRDLGRVFMLAELAVATAGWGLSINPFDQPNVQQAKDATKRVLDGIDGGPPASPGGDAEGAVALLLEARPPEYVALMGYLPSSAEIDRAAGELRAAVRAATRATTTFGYGPRFLHSTGQLHKGGPRSGRFLQLLHQPREDVEIPDAPYTFATLEAAQAQGDFETLRGTGRPVERLTLAGEDLPRSLRHLAAEVARRSGVDRGVDRGSSGGSNPRATQARPA